MSAAPAFPPGDDAFAALVEAVQGGWLTTYNPGLAPAVGQAGAILAAGGTRALALAAVARQGPPLSSRFPEALALAAALHQGRTWAGTAVPTFGHALDLARALILREADEDLILASLFHEGVPMNPAELARRFGEGAGAALACTRPRQSLPHPHEQSWARPGQPEACDLPDRALLLYGCDAVLLGEGLLEDYRSLCREPESDDPRQPLRDMFQALCSIFPGESLLHQAEEAVIWSRYGTLAPAWVQDQAALQQTLSRRGLPDVAADLGHALRQVRGATDGFQLALLPHLDQVWAALDPQQAALLLRRLGARTLALALRGPGWERPRQALLAKLPASAGDYLAERLESPLKDPAPIGPAREELLRVLQALPHPPGRLP